MNSFFELLQSFWHYLSYPIFKVSGGPISLFSIGLAILILVVSIKVSKVTENFVNTFLKDKEIDRGVKGSLSRMARYLVFFAGILITLDTVGIGLNSLAAIGAVLMVGVGFGLQNITQNFISGLIILMERPIKNGDLVEVKGVSGRVVDIRARYTVIYTRDDVAIIVPNSQFITEQVTNESFSGDKIRLAISIGVAYGSDVGKVKEILIKVASGHSSVLSFPAADVHFKNFGDSSLDFKLLIWISDMWNHEKILSDLRFSIDQAFREEDIVIPFPQRDVHTYSTQNNSQ